MLSQEYMPSSKNSTNSVLGGTSWSLGTLMNTKTDSRVLQQSIQLMKEERNLVNWRRQWKSSCKYAVGEKKSCRCIDCSSIVDNHLSVFCIAILLINCGESNLCWERDILTFRSLLFCKLVRGVHARECQVAKTRDAKNECGSQRRKNRDCSHSQSKWSLRTPHNGNIRLADG